MSRPTFSAPFRVSLVLMGAFAAHVYFTSWIYVGVPHLIPLYLDLHAILSAVDCHRMGINVYVSNPCDALRRGLGYSRLWLWLSHLGLERDLNNILGFAIGMLFMACAAHATRPLRLRDQIITVAFVLSPAIMLGVERANNDILMFMLLFVASRLAAGPRTAWGQRTGAVAAWLLIWLGAFLKFYPGVALAAAMEQINDRRTLFGFFALCIALTVLFVVYIGPDLVHLRNTVPSPQGRWTFGAKVVFQMFGYHPYATGLGIGAVVIATVIGVAVAARANWPPIRVGAADHFLFNASVVTLVFCFALKANHDYRCVFLLGTLPVLFTALNTNGALRV
ncbi:MAG: hypothetical protein K0U93_00150, partial [Gammaproteobacteria bacterium]|nr:hypothetical protein [Gammaproteobacteria bacterium]